MKLYSLKCKSLKIYEPPFVCSDDGHALSIVRESIRRGVENPSPETDRLLCAVEDYSLFCVGDFDSKEGLRRARPTLLMDILKIPGVYELLKEVKERVEP